MRGSKDSKEKQGFVSSDEGTAVEVSENIFADLGLPDAKEYNAKAHLALTIRRLIKEHRATQKAAALQSGVKQSDLSNIVNGRLDGISMERLTNVLNHLDQDVEITVRPKRDGCARTYVYSSDSRAVSPMIAIGKK